MKIPIEGDKIQIRDGEQVSEEACFESAAEVARNQFEAERLDRIRNPLKYLGK